MKFTFCILSVKTTSLSLLNNIRKNFVLIFEHPEIVEPIVKEPNPSLLPTQRAGKCCCDITGRVSKS